MTARKAPRRTTPADKTDERRRSVRLNPDVLSAVLASGEEWQVVMVRDISRDGLRIANAPTGLKSGDRFQLTAYTGGPVRLTVECRVVHVGGNLAHSTIGAEFVNPDSSTRTALVAFLEKLASRQHDEAVAQDHAA